MKILRKPKLLPIGCKRCGCLFQPKRRNLTFEEQLNIKDVVICPICNTINRANFEIERNENERETD